MLNVYNLSLSLSLSLYDSYTKTSLFNVGVWYNNKTLAEAITYYLYLCDASQEVALPPPPLSHVPGV